MICLCWYVLLMYKIPTPEMYEHPLLGGMVSLPSAQQGSTFPNLSEKPMKRISGAGCLPGRSYSVLRTSPVSFFLKGELPGILFIYIKKTLHSLPLVKRLMAQKSGQLTSWYDTYHIIPLFTTGFSTIQPVVVVWDFWTINSMSNAALGPQVASQTMGFYTTDVPFEVAKARFFHHMDGCLVDSLIR